MKLKYLLLCPSGEDGYRTDYQYAHGSTHLTVANSVKRMVEMQADLEYMEPL